MIVSVSTIKLLSDLGDSSACYAFTGYIFSQSFNAYPAWYWNQLTDRFEPIV